MIIFLSIIQILIISIISSPPPEQRFVLDADRDLKFAEATVYLPGGATITRYFSISSDHVTKETDKISVTFKNLEFELDENSLSTMGKYGEKENLEISEVLVSNSDVSQEMIGLESEIEGIRKDLDKVKEKLAESDRIRAFFEKFVNDATNEKCSVNDFKEAMTYYLQQKEEMIVQREEWKNLKEEKMKMISELEKRKIELRSLILKEVTTSFDISSIEEIKEGKLFEFNIKYNVRSAEWKPSYTVHVDSKEMTSTLDYFGNIAQWTGKDWNGFEISLSSSSIERATKPPEVSKKIVNYLEVDRDLYYITNYEDTRRRGKELFDINKVSSVSEDFVFLSHVESSGEDYDMNRMNLRDFGSEKKEFAIQERFGVSNTILYEILDKEIGVRSGHGKYTKVTIVKGFTLTSRFNHFIFPQKSDNVFLQMILNYEKELTLFPGLMNLMVDSAFVSKTNVDDIVRENDEVELWIGKDSFVNVKVLPLVSNNENRGFISKTLTKTEKIDIFIENGRENQINLTVIEALPTTHKSNKDKIKVFLLSPLDFGNRQLNDPDGFYDVGEIENSLKFFEEDEELEEIFVEEGKVVVKTNKQNIYKLTLDLILERNFLMEAKGKKVVKLQYKVDSKL